MTDITELAQSLKAAAQNLDGDNWHNEGASVYGESYDVGGTVCYDHIVDCERVNGESPVAEFIALANPANILALVEEREELRAQVSTQEDFIREQDHLIGNLKSNLQTLMQRIAELENDEIRHRLANAEHQLHMAGLRFHNIKASRNAQFKKRKAAERRIAELESRTVTVKLPDFRHEHFNSNWGEHDAAAYQVALREALTAAGIKWEAE